MNKPPRISTEGGGNPLGPRMPRYFAFPGEDQGGADEQSGGARPVRKPQTHQTPVADLGQDRDKREAAQGNEGGKLFGMGLSWLPQDVDITP